MKNRQAEVIKQMTDREIIFHLLTTQLIIITVAIILSWFVFEDIHVFIKLWQWNFEEVIFYGGGSAIIVIGVDLILMKILPKHLYDDGGINEKIFHNRPILQIFMITLFVAFSEELLFRGVVQTHFGYIVASLSFAILHIRYLYKIVLFIMVVWVSFYIGWIYMITGNLLVTIFMHFCIDFVFALIIRTKKISEVSNKR